MSQKKNPQFKESEKRILKDISELRALLSEIDQKLEHLIRAFRRDRFSLHSSNSTLNEFMS